MAVLLNILRSLTDDDKLKALRQLRTIGSIYETPICSVPLIPDKISKAASARLIRV